MRIAPGVRNKANSNLSVEKMLRTLAKTLGLEEGEPEMYAGIGPHYLDVSFVIAAD